MSSTGSSSIKTVVKAPSDEKYQSKHIKDNHSSTIDQVCKNIPLISIATILSGSIVCYLTKCYEFKVKVNKNAPADYHFLSLNDLWITFESMIYLGLLNWACLQVLARIFRPLCKELLYFTFITVYGYIAIKDEAYFPNFLGGKGDIHLVFQGFPYKQTSLGLQNFLLISLGYHSAMLLKLIILERDRVDFIEMCLHDVITICLILGCQFLNIQDSGAICAWLHDVSDILLIASKVLNETHLDTLTGILFVSEVAVWFYVRICAFPWFTYVIYTEMFKLDFGSKFIVQFSVFGLLCLWFMHIYWFTLLMKILIKFIGGKKLEDNRERKEKPKEQKYEKVEHINDKNQKSTESN